MELCHYFFTLFMCVSNPMCYFFASSTTANTIAINNFANLNAGTFNLRQLLCLIRRLRHLHQSVFVCFLIRNSPQ